MKQKQDNQFSPLNAVKWGVVIALLAGGLFANYYYANQAVSLRLIAWLVLLCVVLTVAAFTSQGKSALAFAREAKVELQKVVWPSRQEAVQSTLMVVAMVFIVGIALWGIDTVLMWAIGMLTGQRG